MTIHTPEILSEFSTTGKQGGGICVIQGKAYNYFHSFKPICILSNVQYNLKLVNVNTTANQNFFWRILAGLLLEGIAENCSW